LRLLLKLRATKDSKLVSLNSNYALSSSIYKLLKFGSPEFSEFLHEIGYKSNDKTYKLFSFTIKYKATELSNNALKLNSPFAYLYITTTLVDDFIKNFLIGTFNQQSIEIYSNYIKTKFLIEQIEIIPPPQFKESMYFQMISPMVLSTYLPDKPTAYYLRYDDDIKIINRLFNHNLMNKYEAVRNKKYNGKGVQLKWDDDYAIKAFKQGKRLSKKVTINKDINNAVDIIGIFCPYTVEGDVELIELGYECGFGEKNSMGFGMVKAE